MRVPYKHEDLAEILRKKIAGTACGSRLPSVRSLIKRYNVSLPTINAALRKLESENLIVTKRGSGIFVSNQRSSKFIVFHRTGSPSKNNDVKEVSLLRAVSGQEWHFSTRRHDFVSAGKSSMTVEPLASAHLVMPDLVDLNLDFLHQLVRQNVPIVIIGRDAGALGFDHITGNDQQMMNLLIRHLHELGHRNLALLVNEPHFYEIKLRIDLFSECLAMRDLPAGTIIDCETKQGEESSVMAYHGLIRYLKETRKPPFTAVIVASAAGGLGALRALHEVGIQVPQACSVACYGTEPENSLTIPTLTSAGDDIAALGNGVVSLLKQRFAGDKTPSLGMKTPVELLIGESTSKVN